MWRAIHQKQLLDPRMYAQPAENERLWLRLTVNADSHGRITGHPLTLKHTLMLLDWTPTDTAERLFMLCTAGLVDWYGMTELDSVVEVADFSETQSIRRIGQAQLPPRGTKHRDGSEIFGHMLTRSNPVDSRTTPGHSGSTPANRTIQVNKRAVANPVVNGSKPVTDQGTPSDDGLSLVADAWRKHTRRSRKLTRDEEKRISSVLRKHTADEVCEYLASALRDPWYWGTSPDGRSLIHRRDVCCIFTTKQPSPWDRRIANFLETRGAASGGSVTYQPSDPEAAAADFAATLAGGAA